MGIMCDEELSSQGRERPWLSWFWGRQEKEGLLLTNVSS